MSGVNLKVEAHQRYMKGFADMHWEILIALIIAVPVILFPAAYLWYMDIGGIFSTYKAARARHAARKM
jgi:hypothetical protein